MRRNLFGPRIWILLGAVLWASAGNGGAVPSEKSSRQGTEAKQTKTDVRKSGAKKIPDSAIQEKPLSARKAKKNPDMPAVEAENPEAKDAVVISRFKQGAVKSEFIPSGRGEGGVKKRYDSETGKLKYEITYDDKGRLVQKKKFDRDGNVIYDRKLGEVIVGQKKDWGQSRSPV